MKLKRFIVRKYIMAASAADAIKRDKRSPVEDVWLDDKWREIEDELTTITEIGFKQNGRKSVVSKVRKGV